VAGLVALVIAAHPTYSPLQVRNLICSTATDCGDAGADPWYGYGEINPINAMIAATGQNLDNTWLPDDGVLLYGISVSVCDKVVDGFDGKKQNLVTAIDYSSLLKILKLDGLLLS
jgi:subtilisin family serine protease